MTDRDAIDRAVLPTDQIFVRTDLVPPGVLIAGSNEWLLIQTVNPSGPTANAIPLRGSNGQQVLAGEPFYVAGLQTFENLTSSPLYVSRAPRRELLSDGLSSKEFPGNGGGCSDLYNETFVTPAIATPASEWVYLDANLQWALASLGNTPGGLPFGWDAPNPLFRGRYYDVEIKLNAGTAGNKQVFYATSSAPDGSSSSISFFDMSNPIFVTNPNVIFGVGDEAGPLNTSVVFANARMNTAKATRRWTVGVTVAAAGSVSGFMSVLRRGF